MSGSERPPLRIMAAIIIAIIAGGALLLGVFRMSGASG